MVDTTHAPGTSRGIRPLEEGQDRARLPPLVAEVEVVRARDVEVDRSLDEREAEQIAVERQRPPRVLGHHRHVVEPLSHVVRQCALLPCSLTKPLIDLACALVPPHKVVSP